MAQVDGLQAVKEVVQPCNLADPVAAQVQIFDPFQHDELPDIFEAVRGEVEVHYILENLDLDAV